MANYRRIVSENLHALNRQLSSKFDRPLSINDTILYLTLYYAKKTGLNIELHQGMWEVEEINGDDDGEKELVRLWNVNSVDSSLAINHYF